MTGKTKSIAVKMCNQNSCFKEFGFYKYLTKWRKPSVSVRFLAEYQKLGFHQFVNPDIYCFSGRLISPVCIQELHNCFKKIN